MPVRGAMTPFLRTKLLSFGGKLGLFGLNYAYLGFNFAFLRDEVTLFFGAIAHNFTPKECNFNPLWWL